MYNYIDDFMSLDFEERSWSAYNVMDNLLRDIGVCEAEGKSVAPTQIIEFLGGVIQFRNYDDINTQR